MSDIGSSTTVTKLLIKDQQLYLKISWEPNNDDLFNINIFENDVCWYGSFSRIAANECRKRYTRETEEEYKNNTKFALSEDNASLFSYTFEIDSVSKETATFRWKKKFEGSTALQLLGLVHVNLVLKTNAKDILVEFLIKEYKDLNKVCDALNKNTAFLENQLVICKNEMEKFVNAKIELEQTLYGKFVTLLNSKKRRIQLLENTIKNFDEP